MTNSYQVIHTPKFDKQLAKLDKSVSKHIVHWMKNHLDKTTNPHISGHALKGKLSGLWRYRIGDYRVIAQIEHNKLIILCLKVGHRRDIYQD
ncbi:type II toxin-antitoxin system RelE/ParE family toxin [Candidatus Saccharibacteria bacterium]|nr:type II toxin-antitoxin system RelE/ParE family toxin [Candidatus Saccharibacteria bacterium]